MTSLLGQQISWLAARSITHKFTRLFFPHLPEKLPPPGSTEPKLETPFPTPHQVLDLPDRTAALRGAGLSGRKVEYVVELAERFADGRLDARKLWAMNDDELMEVGRRLLRVRGPEPLFSDLRPLVTSHYQPVLRLPPRNHTIRLSSLYEVSAAGRSRCSSSLPRNAPTSSPAAISVSPQSSRLQPSSLSVLFWWSIRLFLILCPGQLNHVGIQKNLCKWFSHDPALAPSIHPRKVAGASPTKLATAAATTEPESPSKLQQGEAQTVNDSAATVPSARTHNGSEGVGLGKLAALGGASVEQELVVDLDQPATPPRTSTKRAEEEEGKAVVEFVFPETSNNLTPAILKSRLNGKKLKYAGLLAFFL